MPLTANIVKFFDTVERPTGADNSAPSGSSNLGGGPAALLQQGVSLVLVDLVTVRNFNLYTELLRMIGERDPAMGNQPPSTYAAAFALPDSGKRALTVLRVTLARI